MYFAHIAHCVNNLYKHIVALPIVSSSANTQEQHVCYVTEISLVVDSPANKVNLLDLASIEED